MHDLRHLSTCMEFLRQSWINILPLRYSLFLSFSFHLLVFPSSFGFYLLSRSSKLRSFLSIPICLTDSLDIPLIESRRLVILHLVGGSAHFLLYAIPFIILNTSQPSDLGFCALRFLFPCYIVSPLLYKSFCLRCKHARLLASEGPFCVNHLGGYLWILCSALLAVEFWQRRDDVHVFYSTIPAGEAFNVFNRGYLVLA